jgi:hypothetical protein
VFCAVIGMFLAVPGLPNPAVVFAATVGIALVAGAAAAINCLVEQKIDAKMARTRARPLPAGELTSTQTLVFASLVGGTGLAILGAWVNLLTMGLTLATFVGYAIVYTGAPQARDAAEHRDRRRVGRDAAGAGMDGDHQRHRARGADPVPDHLRVDAAALLVARALPHAGLRARRAADAAGHATARATRA